MGSVFVVEPAHDELHDTAQLVGLDQGTRGALRAGMSSVGAGSKMRTSSTPDEQRSAALPLQHAEEKVFA